MIDEIINSSTYNEFKNSVDKPYFKENYKKQNIKTLSLKKNNPFYKNKHEGYINKYEIDNDKRLNNL
jgi:hypothetical protein